MTVTLTKEIRSPALRNLSERKKDNVPVARGLQYVGHNGRRAAVR